MTRWGKSRRDTAGLLALAAVDILTAAALFTSEVIVVVSASVGGLIDDWRNER